MVIVVPDVSEYKQMNDESKYETVKRLNLVNMASLMGEYPRSEVQTGIIKARELLVWIAKETYPIDYQTNEWSEKIRFLAEYQVREFMGNPSVFLSVFGEKMAVVGDAIEQYLIKGVNEDRENPPVAIGQNGEPYVGIFYDGLIYTQVTRALPDLSEVRDALFDWAKRNGYKLQKVE